VRPHERDNQNCDDQNDGDRERGDVQTISLLDREPSSGLLWKRFAGKQRDKAVSLPNLYIAVVYELPRCFDRFFVIGAFDDLYAQKVRGGANGIDAIMGHKLRSLANRRERNWSLSHRRRGRAPADDSSIMRLSVLG
jgi:hypothetical protein